MAFNRLAKSPRSALPVLEKSILEKYVVASSLPPMEEALDSLALPEPVLDALLHNRGVFAPFLALTKACESGDDTLFAHYVDALNLSSRQVNMAHMEALAWADHLDQA